MCDLDAAIDCQLTAVSEDQADVSRDSDTAVNGDAVLCYIPAIVPRRVALRHQSGAGDTLRRSIFIQIGHLCACGIFCRGLRQRLRRQDLRERDLLRYRSGFLCRRCVRLVRRLLRALGLRRQNLRERGFLHRRGGILLGCGRDPCGQRSGQQSRQRSRSQPGPKLFSHCISS